MSGCWYYGHDYESTSFGRRCRGCGFEGHTRERIKNVEVVEKTLDRYDVV